MAYGLAEPHGAYNAIGLDWVKAYALCQRAATAHGGVVAPPFCWHVQESPHFDWPKINGTTQSLSSSIPGDLFLRMVLHQLRVFDARGFHAAILITGHYGGLEKDMRLLCDFYSRQTGSPLKIHCIADWECIEYLDYAGDHAGPCETQQLMALRPELVDLSRAAPSETSDPWCGVTFPDTATPTKEVGERIVASQVEALGRVHRDLLRHYKPITGWAAPDQNQAEAIWHIFERATRKYWVLSSCQAEYGQPPPEFPGWEELGL